MRLEINKIKNKKKIKKIDKPKFWFFEKITKIDKPLARLTRKKQRKLELLKLEMEVGTLLLISQKSKGL